MARDQRRAVLCTKCRQLISNQEKKCPFCGALQPNLFGFGGALRKLYRDQLEPVNVFLMASVGLYILSLAIRPQELLNPPSLLHIGAPSGRALYLLGMTGGLAWCRDHLWTLLTASFLHGSILHIVFNLSWLRSLGPMTVGYLGPARFVVLYLLTGVGGFLLSNLVGSPPTIGASASLFGLMGGLAMFGWRRGGTVGAALRGSMLYYAAIGFALAFAIPGVNNWAHLGGFLSGGLIALMMPKHEQQHEARGVQLLALALILITVVGFGLSAWRMWDHFLDGNLRCI